MTVAEPVVSTRKRGRRLGYAAALLIAAGAAILSIATARLVPPSLKLKPIAFATANAQALIGTRGADVGKNNTVDGVYFASQRASTLANLMASPELRRYIAQASGVPLAQLAVDGPIPINLPVEQQEPDGPKRGTQIIVEHDLYRLTVNNDPSSPIIGVTAQAPTTQGAAALANGSLAGLARYLHALEVPAGTPIAERYQVTMLGPVSVIPPSHAAPEICALTFGFVLLICCGLVRAASSLVAAVRCRAAGLSKVGIELDRSLA